MSEVIAGLHSVTLHIRDVTAASSFYREVLGLRELLVDSRQGRAVYAIPGTSTLLTMHVQRPGEGGREPGTVSGLVFHHPDPAAACAEIRRRGGTITMEPVEFETSIGKFVRAVIADPDGNEFLISNRTD